MANKILMIEDDKTLARGLCKAFESEKIMAEYVTTLYEARKTIEEFEPDLLILDINLPDGEGLSLIEEVKEKYDMPIILLTANDTEMDVVVGLEQGADDYVTKPFSLAILRARVHAKLREKNKRSENVYRYREYVFNYDRMEFYKADEQIILSKTEQKLLRLLTDYAGRTLTRGQLIDRVWTDGAEYVDENALSVTIKRLRDKLDASDRIKTVYGIGYMWEI